MRTYVIALSFIYSLVVCPAWAYDFVLPAETGGEVYYSPRGGGQTAIVRHVDAARKSIYLLAYSFTSRPIADALERAARRGVDVEAILDRSQRRARGGRGAELAASGARVLVDCRHAIAHNKVLIIDGRYLVTGSYNFTASAEFRNAENLLILDSPSLAQLYRNAWTHYADETVPW